MKVGKHERPKIKFQFSVQQKTGWDDGIFLHDEDNTIRLRVGDTLEDFDAFVMQFKSMRQELIDEYSDKV